MLVNSLTLTTLNSDHRKAARLREPVRTRSPGRNTSLIWAAAQAAEPFRPISTFPSFSINTQVLAAGGGVLSPAPHSIAQKRVPTDIRRANRVPTLSE